MQFIDIAILVILGLFFLIGLVRGLVRQIGSIVGFFLSLWVAQHYYASAAAMIKPSLSQWPLIAGALSVAIGYIVLYFLVSFLFGLLVKLIDHSLKLFSLFPLVHLVNRLGGAIVGLIEGMLLLSVILFIANAIPTKEFSEPLKKSSLAPVVKGMSGIIRPLLPEMPSFDMHMFNQKSSGLEGLSGLKLDNLDLKNFNQKDLSSFEDILKKFEEEQKPQKKK